VSATLLALFADYGLVALFFLLLVASIGLPLPSSLLLLAAGSLAEQGDFDPVLAFVAAVTAAIAGDQIGYFIGRWGGRHVVGRIAAKLGATDKVDKAEAFARRWAGAGIFFTRWLVGALGPWINITSGMSDYPWSRFIVWDVAGELLWVALYGGLGYVFSDRIQAIAELLANLSWAIVGIALTGFLAFRVYRLLRPVDATADTPATSDVAQGL
jgi:membrane-associated protein